MNCSACGLPTSEFFGDRNDLCGNCDDLGFSSVPFTSDDFPEDFDEQDEEDFYDDHEDVMCDLAFEYDYDDGRFDFMEGFHQDY
jgi:hypothetical protein